MTNIATTHQRAAASLGSPYNHGCSGLRLCASRFNDHRHHRRRRRHFFRCRCSSPFCFALSLSSHLVWIHMHLNAFDRGVDSVALASPKMPVTLTLATRCIVACTLVHTRCLGMQTVGLKKARMSGRTELPFSGRLIKLPFLSSAQSIFFLPYFLISWWLQLPWLVPLLPLQLLFQVF